MMQRRSEQNNRGADRDRRPQSPATIPEILAHSVRSFGQDVAMRTCGGMPDGSYTYGQIGGAALAAAGRLLARGASKAAPQALLCENRPQWAAAFFAIHLTGAPCVPIDINLAPPQWASIVQRSGAQLVLASRAFAEPAAAAVAEMPGVSIVVVEDLLAEPPAETAAEATADQIASRAEAAAGPDDVAVIAFTSGTSGTAKGVVLTHGNIASNAAAGTRRMDVRGDDCLLSVLPLSHLFEQTAGMLAPFLVGGRAVYPSTLSPRALAETLRQSGTTIALIAATSGLD